MLEKNYRINYDEKVSKIIKNLNLLFATVRVISPSSGDIYIFKKAVFSSPVRTLAV